MLGRYEILNREMYDYKEILKFFCRVIFSKIGEIHMYEALPPK